MSNPGKRTSSDSNFLSRRLSFSDNFLSFETVITIPGNTEVSIINRLKNTVPSQWIVTDIVGDGRVSRGDTPWELTTLYLRNPTSDEVTAKVLFLR